MADRPRKGRCAGCAKEFTSLRAARGHVTTCSDYARLYHENPAAALDPEQEWVRVQEEKSDEALRSVRKTEIRQRLSAESDRKLAVAAERWKSGRFTSQRSSGISVATPENVPRPVVYDGYGLATASFLQTLNEVVDATS